MILGFSSVPTANRQLRGNSFERSKPTPQRAIKMSEPSSTASDGHKCPVCRIDLLMSERQGIEIEYCPKCRGVWLDRGELDKIIERSRGETSTAPAAASPAGSFLPPGAPGPWIQPPRQPSHDASQHRQEHDDRRDRYDGGEHRRGGGFLSNLFD